MIAPQCLQFLWKTTIEWLTYSCLFFLRFKKKFNKRLLFVRFTPHSFNSVLNVGVALIVKFEYLSYAIYVTLSCTFCFISFPKGTCISCSKYKVNTVVFSI